MGTARASTARTGRRYARPCTGRRAAVPLYRRLIGAGASARAWENQGRGFCRSRGRLRQAPRRLSLACAGGALPACRRRLAGLHRAAPTGLPRPGGAACQGTLCAGQCRSERPRVAPLAARRDRSGGRRLAKENVHQSLVHPATSLLRRPAGTRAHPTGNIGEKPWSVYRNGATSPAQRCRSSWGTNAAARYFVETPPSSLLMTAARAGSNSARTPATRRSSIPARTRATTLSSSSARIGARSRGRMVE